MKETEKACRKEIRKLENPANANHTNQEQDLRGRKLKFGSNFTKKTKKAEKI